jgi:heat shock protein HtpX
VPAAPAPLLVYDRIQANVRATRWLLLAFSVAAFPAISAGAVFVVPFVMVFGGAIAFAVYGSELVAQLETLDAAMRGASIVSVFDLPRPVLIIIGVALALAIAATIAAFAAATAFLIARYGSRMLLRLVGARPVTAAQQPDLYRLVENLCIGAGLPTPAVYVADSKAPNAFAAGRSPQQAAIVVTTGLLALLNRRELAGVVAHELSHIGNHDIRLTTTLAAVVGTLTAGMRATIAGIRLAFKTHWMAGNVVAAGAVGLMLALAGSVWSGLAAIVYPDPGEQIPAFERWWAIHAMIAPLYAMFAAPIVALIIQRAVSWQREFLADADAALLTRDPEGLMQALVKIAEARGERLPAGAGSARVYIVDPRGEPRTLAQQMFRTHPPVEQRIDLLARMGAGLHPVPRSA